jgi:hypothetical protein
MMLMMLKIIVKIFFEIFFIGSSIYFFSILTPEKSIQMRNNCYNLMYNLTYNIIYIFSVCQIKYNKLCACVVKYLHDEQVIYQVYNPEFDNNDIITITFFNNAEPIKETVCFNSKKELNNLFIKDNEPINYNLLIMSIPSKNNEESRVTTESAYKQRNKVMISSLYNTNIIDFTRSYTYEESSFKFISINLTYNNKTYPIYLKNDEYNYYIVNNIIDKIFFQYYLVNILKVKLIEQLHDFRYILEIMDHNVNMFSLNESQYIIFKKDDYSVLQIEPMREIVFDTHQLTDTVETVDTVEIVETTDTTDTVETTDTMETTDTVETAETAETTETTETVDTVETVETVETTETTVETVDTVDTVETINTENE